MQQALRCSSEARDCPREGGDGFFGWHFVAIADGEEGWQTVFYGRRLLSEVSSPYRLAEMLAVYQGTGDGPEREVSAVTLIDESGQACAEQRLRRTSWNGSVDVWDVPTSEMVWSQVERGTVQAAFFDFACQGPRPDQVRITCSPREHSTLLLAASEI